MNRSFNETVHKKRLVIGFTASILCTLLVFFSVTTNWFSNQQGTVGFILVFAIIQTLVQSWFFLHLNEEKKPRWQLHSFWFTVVMSLVIVIGSLWVMINLNYNMGMSPKQMDEYMIQQSKKGF